MKVSVLAEFKTSSVFCPQTNMGGFICIFREKKNLFFPPKFALCLQFSFFTQTFILSIKVADVSKLTSPIIIFINGANLSSPLKPKAKLCHITFSSAFQKGRDYPVALKLCFHGGKEFWILHCLLAMHNRRIHNTI